ncbi:hypothetical protein C7212DRAFT_276900 [Tuber magnatum]|uniref:Uncharacterized protein n=1 Tax=Tuber magnatum TaxID=42249 RepID=A0A317SWV1_9PEZI|nr:hypothetical protein C7212DRAFT_276900 [Tuber magnatum]
MTESSIDILSDDPIRYRETFILKSKATVKFTSVFKLDNVPNAPPQYFDTSPHLKSSHNRWWSFKTKSSSFIFRRNLETILSHAMPLPKIKGDKYRPYVLHDHNLTNTFQTWSASLNQALYLLEIDKILQYPDTAGEATKSHYRERIRKVIFGYFVWLLWYAERNVFPETAPLHWPGKLMPPAKKYETRGIPGEVKKEKGKEVLNRYTKKYPVAEVEPSAGLAEGSTSQSDVLYPEEPDNPSPAKPVEPELSKYEDKFRNCCQFLILLGRCLENYPKEERLFTQMVEAFLKPAWEPIEMSKHQGSQLWPEQLEGPGEFPPPYARFLDWGDYENCGYGQGIYVYVITTQVLVWRAVKSTNRLLKLVSNDKGWSKWTIDKSLGDEAIRDQTTEVFRRLDADTSRDCFPDRFYSKIKGHIRESLLDQWSCDIVVPSFVEDFFFDDKNEPLSAWTETLRYYDTFSDSTKSQTPNIWEYFMRYQLTIDNDRRQALRESFEARAYSVGLFTNDAVIPSSHCPHTTSWEIVTYVLSADHTEELYPQATDHPARADQAQGPTLPQEGLMNAGINPNADAGAGVRQDGRKRRKLGKGFDITAEDRRQVNDPPSYGQWHWFREPLFMKHKPKEFEVNREFIKRFLQPEINWSYFWETSQGRDNFMENVVDAPNYDWGDEKNTLIQPSRSGKHRRFPGGEALLKLRERRDPQVDKKRIFDMKDCTIEHLIALMASIDFQEAGHIGEFLSRLRIMDPQEMRFAEQTIMPDNLWITEFNINFITAPLLANREWPHPSNYFSKKHAKFQNINDVIPDRVMAEAAMGFRIIGDLHDRYWTCYVFYDFGTKELTSEARNIVLQSDYGRSSSQRKCLEGFLVRQALDLVLVEAKTVLQTIAKSTRRKNEKSQTLFNPFLTEDDLSGENYLKTMNKNIVFYPWLLDVYGALRDKCNKSRNVAEQWITAEGTRKYKPRWSEKDQKSFGEEVAKNQMEVKTRCTRLEKMAKNSQERIDRIKTLKEWLSSELALREARTSTQLAYTVNLFAVVTTIYLPLTFSAAIVAIQDFRWSSPAKALAKITLAVAFGTLILLMNISLLRRSLAALKTWAQHLVRRGMEGVPDSEGFPTGSVCREKRPTWAYWSERANNLHEVEKRTVPTINATPASESGWWYMYFVAIFIVIVFPVQELTFTIHTLQLQPIENSGPLKKLVRVPWAPIWIVQLSLVYVIMLVGCAIRSSVRLVHRAAVWLWIGKDIAGDGRAPAGEDGGGSGSEPGTVQKGRLVGWLVEPAKIMQLLVIAEALAFKEKKKGSDEESQEAVRTSPAARGMDVVSSNAGEVSTCTLR